MNLESNQVGAVMFTGNPTGFNTTAVDGIDVRRREHRVGTSSRFDHRHTRGVRTTASREPRLSFNLAGN